jgi:N12 class adenine-specific DNA methylase
LDQLLQNNQNVIAEVNHLYFFSIHYSHQQFAKWQAIKQEFTMSGHISTVQMVVVGKTLCACASMTHQTNIKRSSGVFSLARNILKGPVTVPLSQHFL